MDPEPLPETLPSLDWEEYPSFFPETPQETWSDSYPNDE
jgi:hypothetical protein